MRPTFYACAFLDAIGASTPRSGSRASWPTPASKHLLEPRRRL